MRSEITLGPILFQWPAEEKRDFYFRIADESDVDTVYLGEVVCSKRVPLFEPHYQEVAERLVQGGKKVVFSSLAEVMIKKDRDIVSELCRQPDYEIEANDASALWHVKGRPHRIGPYLNVYHEKTMAHLVKNGATHVSLGSELPGIVIHNMSEAAEELGISLEVQVFGRLSLALSARCYHARAWDRVKDNCKFVCEESPNGMSLETLDGKNFLAINGIQTLSYNYLNLMNEMLQMQEYGIQAFRLSPHQCDMLKIIRLYRAVLDQTMSPQDATQQLDETGLELPQCNGFYHQTDGFRWIDNTRVI